MPIPTSNLTVLTGIVMWVHMVMWVAYHFFGLSREDREPIMQCIGPLALPFGTTLMLTTGRKESFQNLSILLNYPSIHYIRFESHLSHTDRDSVLIHARRGG